MTNSTSLETESYQQTFQWQGKYRENPVYQSAILFDPNVKNYNKTQLKSVISKKRKKVDFVTKQNIIRERFEELGSLQEKPNAPSFRKIGKSFFVNDRTVNSIINRYKKLHGRLYPEPMKRINKNIDPRKLK